MVQDFFPRVTPPTEQDTNLTQAILGRNAELTPTPDEQTNLVNLMAKVQIVLENLTLSPGSFNACLIDEVRQVGSFKCGTMISGKSKADLVVILKTMPTLSCIKPLEEKLLEELIKIDPSTALELKTEPILGGFEVINAQKGAAVCILLTTIMPNFRKIDESIHINLRLVQRHMSSIRHVRWFEETANLTTIKVLVRVLKDICNRFAGFRALTPWMIVVLTHYAVTFNTSTQLLQLNQAFKRVLQLLAGGLFLPGSSGIPDPCESGAITLHTPLTLQQQDQICMTAQTLIRVLAHSNELIILGIVPDTLGLCENTTTFDEVVLVPCLPAYDDTRKSLEQNNGHTSNE
jgi:interleukin enhancer-binding factor 2